MNPLCRLSLAPLLLVLLVFQGCAQIPAQFRYQPDGSAVTEMVWPGPPEVPRYRYVGQLTGEENFYRPGEESANAGQRFLRWVVGLVGHPPNPVVLQRPQAVTGSADGRLYVSDVSRQAVFMFDTVQGRLEVWESAGDELRFMMPIGVALGANGELLVADAALKFVVRLGPDGLPLGRIGEGLLKHPAGVARDPARGRIYVADRGDNLIRVFDDSGAVVTTLGGFGEGPGQFNAPTYLDWRGDRLYVTDTLNSRIQIFSPEGELVSKFGRPGLYLGELPRPKGVTVDSKGNIYVVESYYDYLLVFNRNGELLLPIGGAGHELGQFFLPSGIWADGNDRIYVADTFNGRVMIFEYLGAGDGVEQVENGGAAVRSVTTQ
jgi:streptogramin lyase